MSYVIVERPGGRSVFQQADADVFERDTLTISCPAVEALNPWQVFQPGAWLSATAFDEANDLPLYSFQSAQRQRHIDAVVVEHQPAAERTVA